VSAAGLPVKVTVGLALVQFVDPLVKNGVTCTVVVGGVTPATRITEELVDPAPLPPVFIPGPLKLTSPFCGQELLASGPSSGHPPASLNSRNPKVVLLVMGATGSNVDVNRKSGALVCGQLAPDAVPLPGSVQTCVFRAQLPPRLASGMQVVPAKGVPATDKAYASCVIELLVTTGVALGLVLELTGTSE